MKFTKMSLVAALLVGSSAFAIENVKVSGDAKLYYSTDNTAKNDLFNKTGSAGQAAASLSLSADLTKGISAGTKVTALSTLGLEGQLVNNVWEGTNGVSDSYIVNDLWLAATAGKTTAKIGRMELDTPLVFSEKWSIVENTFEAAVLINQDIPGTTLVGAYVGGSNGNSYINGALDSLAVPNHGNGAMAVGIANTVQATNNETTFSQFYNGAFAAGAINNSWAPLTVQAWYYDAPQYLDAYWLQADLSMSGLLVGAQYTGTNYTKSTQLPIAKDASNDAWAVMAGYALKDVVTVKIAYSQTGTELDSTLGLGAAGNLASTGQSKLYTEAWWNYGYVTRADTDAINVTVEATVAEIDLGLYYTQTTTGENAVVSTPGYSDIDMTEVTLSASYAFGPLDTSLVYIYTDADDQNINVDTFKSEAYSTVQAYLTYNF